MARRMLIGATHPEETRVVILNRNRIEEFDFETSTKKQLKGNIYLAKVTRVEPSLQAAFVDYGKGRHGFLAFSEIHPDYYQIPISDRRVLLEEEAAIHKSEDAEVRTEPAAAATPEPAAESESETTEPNPQAEATTADQHEEHVETVGGDEIEEAAPRRRPIRSYKIQEVIKRRQILLIQVMKEERGNKGAALTTYISLAGRYCVLMPNTARGGGISRKITSQGDRKRLRDILKSLSIPDGMGVILRTAGLERTKAEIRRDFDYLLRMWNQVRELTLKSTAPALVHEEANLIKRSIRDLYRKDIEEILVDGDEAYRVAKDFMRMLAPSHAKFVQPYKDPNIPLFQRYQIEAQLDEIHSPRIELKSGGYIIINPTEALVSIDVNSGRATKERNIEGTALKTNLEAAEEIARQLRLRDLGGLIVIDFIDMEEGKHRRQIERCLKEAMKTDRARIRLGKISAFGLLEMSRQRLRPSLLEASSESCPHCGGTGIVRSTESTSLHVLRAIEEEGGRKRSAEIVVYVPTDVALYLLNQKRETLAKLEERYSFRVLISRDDSLIPPDFRMEREKSQTGERVEVRPEADKAESGKEGRRSRHRRKAEEKTAEDTPVEAAQDASETTTTAPTEEGEPPRKRRRRGRRGGRRRGRGKAASEENATPAQSSAPAEEKTETAETEKPEKKPRRRHRGRRKAAAPTEAAATSETSGESGESAVSAEPAATAEEPPVTAEAPTN
ncbi:MAG: ribonuclease E/G [Alphaproteobacteria bacterium]|nr:ribonuclease E/G [Alphaproteobacteria bacterium]